MKLYDWKDSYNSRKILAVAFETDQRLELCPMDLMGKKEHKTDEHMKRNPNGKVPVLEHNGQYLWESNAILLYVASLDPKSRLLPTQPMERAQVERWLLWQNAHLSLAIGKISYEKVWKAKFGGGPADPAAIEAAMPEVDRFLGVLNTALAGKNFVEGSLSVADFALATSIGLARELEISLTNFADINRWYHSIAERPSWKNAQKWD